MASYARTQQTSNSNNNNHNNNHHQHHYNHNNQMPVLAQAKPAIISSDSTNFNNSVSTGCLSEKLNSALKLSSSHEREMVKFNFDNQKLLRHIEDDNVLQKQNASNQMRQAAVMSAAASQQKVRLSATERLALTAKRPMTNQQIQSTTTNNNNINTQQNRLSLPPPPPTQPQAANETTNVTSLCNTKSAPLPTLETLLAVQRQLQQHTKQHLNSVPQQLVNHSINNHNSNDQKSSIKTTTATGNCASNQNNTCAPTMIAQRNKPLPPSPPKSPPPIKQQQQQVTNTAHHHKLNQSTCETYEKDLPPLPSSISPSTTTTDDSQMNSLESHQSSPATSLVSIPPPPPPISSYLEQYDEVSNSCHQSVHESSSSSPSTISSISDISSVKQYMPLQVKSHQQQASKTTNHHNHQSASFELPLPSYLSQNQNQNHTTNQHVQQSPKTTELQQQPKNQIPQRPPSLAPKPSLFRHTSSETIIQQQQVQSKQFNAVSQPLARVAQQAPVRSPRAHIAQSEQQNHQNNIKSDQQQVTNSNGYVPQINYQQHVFTLPKPQPNLPSPASSTTRSLSAPFLPPPLHNGTSASAGGGFDQPDSGSFRFPTPPPPDLLLDDEDDDVKIEKKLPVNSDNQEQEEDDDEFECKIPTPPPYKSMSVAANQHHFEQRQPQIKHTSPMFNSSTFSVPAQQQATANGSLQPPALFRQQSAPAVATSAPNPLTVHINNDGLLSTAVTSAHHHGHLVGRHPPKVANHHGDHHHHMMLSMAASSSSPSSSSDGDGQSSNSSSSTSGIHSSIDSPSSSSSKLYDFNYPAATLAKASGKGTKSLMMNMKRPTSAANIMGPTTTTTTAINRHLYESQKSGTLLKQHPSQQQLPPPPPPPPLPPQVQANRTCNSPALSTTTTLPVAIRPALKQKKSVSFSDKVELVACADEQTEDHLPNPLLARVLAGKLQ